MTATWPWATRTLAAFAIAILGCALVAMGWDRGPDVLIDFGRELYVPWRLTEGDILHRDIAWFNGPLGPWLIEAWMRIFGVSFDALQCLNVLVIAACVALLGALVRRFTDDLTTVASAVVFLCVFAVAQQEDIGNFLFLSPYSHGITFGFTLGLVVLFGLARTVSAAGPQRDAGVVAPAVAGLACGWAFLTKAEIFLAVASSAGVMLGAYFASASSQGRRMRTAVTFGLAFVAPLAWAYVRFVREIGAGQAGEALFGTWIHALDPRINEMDFYAKMRGTDDPALHLARMGRCVLWTALFIGVVYSAAVGIAKVTQRRSLSAVSSFGVAAALTLGVLMFVSIKWLLLPLPAALAALGIAAALRWFRGRGGSGSARSITRLGVIVFAGMLLPKIALLPQARQYGFVLAAPGATVLVVLLVRWLPLALIRRRHASETALPALRAAGLAVTMVFAAANLNATRNWFGRKTVSWGTGADRVLAEGYRGVVMKALANELEAVLAPDATLLVIPEGVMLNYQLRRRTPTRIVNYMPPELMLFGEDDIIEELEANPPAAVALILRNTDIYGYPRLGVGYGERLLGWVLERYERVRLIEDDPLEDGTFGAALMLPRRR